MQDEQSWKALNGQKRWRWVLGAVVGASLLAGCGHGQTVPKATVTAHGRYAVAGTRGPGPLFLIGGGDDAPVLLKRFVQLAGGVEAPIVVVPFAGGETNGAMAAAAFRAQGARSVTVVTGSPAAVGSESATMAGAAGLYFTGGLPDRLVASFAPYAAATRQARAAGAVVGGSSAGAMAWGSRVIMKGESEQALAHGVGAETGGLDVEPGLGFLDHTIVDPHFGVRMRFNRLWAATQAEQALGIGLDEATALQVADNGQAEVLGTGAVTLLRPGAGTARVTVLKAGQQANLADWQLP